MKKTKSDKNKKNDVFVAIPLVQLIVNRRWALFERAFQKLQCDFKKPINVLELEFKEQLIEGSLHLVIKTKTKIQQIKPDNYVTCAPNFNGLQNGSGYMWLLSSSLKNAAKQVVSTKRKLVIKTKTKEKK